MNRAYHISPDMLPQTFPAVEPSADMMDSPVARRLARRRAQKRAQEARWRKARNVLAACAVGLGVAMMVLV